MPHNPEATPKARNHTIGVPRVSTIELILSVIEPNVWPGPMMLTGAGPSSLIFSGLCSLLLMRSKAFLVSRSSFLVFISSLVSRETRNQKREKLLAFLAFLQFRIRVRYARDVRCPRARVQLA